MSPTVLPGSKTKSPGVRERNVVYWQFVVAVFLIVFGALLLVIYKWAGIYPPPSGTTDSTFGYVATAIIGAGVAVLPAGAAGAASARILSGLPNIGGGPEATTGAATLSADGQSYTLSGTVNGHGMATNYYFEWGSKAPAYGTTTQVKSTTTSMVAVPAVSEEVAGIAKGDHFRIVAHNAGGTTQGNDQTV